MAKKKEITKQDLLDFGMIEDSDNPLFPLSKTLSINQESLFSQLEGIIENFEENEEVEAFEVEGEISLALYHGNNQNDFVLTLPSGMVFLGITNIKDLEFVERIVLGFEPYD